MEVVSINNPHLIKTKKAFQPLLISEKRRSKFILDVLVFSLSGVKFAIKLTNVAQIRGNYSSIIKINDFDKNNYGICINNNELIKIIDIYSLFNIFNSSINNKLIEFIRGSIKVAVLVDANELVFSSLAIPFESPDVIKYKHIDKIINNGGENIYLINEASLFSEISNYVEL